MRSPRLAAIGALLAASTLALSGCATNPLPPGPTAAQLDAVVASQLSSRWAAFGASTPEPQVARVKYSTVGSWVYDQLSCYQAAGLDATDVSGDFTVGGFLPGDPRADIPDAVPVAIFTCNAQYPIDPLQVGYLTDDQVLYMYDYFANRIAPCLELLGYPVAAPTPRGQYLKALRSGSYWDPYFVGDGTPITDSAADLAHIDLRCPPLPAPYDYYHPVGRVRT